MNLDRLNAMTAAAVLGGEPEASLRMNARRGRQSGTRCERSLHRRPAHRHLVTAHYEPASTSWR